MVLSFNKKISGEDMKKGFRMMQAQIKMLLEFYNNSASLLKEATCDPSIIRKSVTGISCAACDKDVVGLYDHINQTQEFTNWNKFPQRDVGKLVKIHLA